MPVLTSEQRETLKNTVVRARYLAELGARDALTALAVGASEPFASMDEEQRRLRNRLRAHGRQLGDQRDPQKGTQTIERLVREMAYAHWHRMLFARFLAENQLLIEPSSGVAISLDECEELAVEEGTDLWGLAAQFAQAMLPQIFRVDDPVLAAKLPIEISQKLRLLVAQLNAEVFAASDSLGWSYQFWQSRINEKVKKLMKSGIKVGADEIAPVTQYFTEDYMVDFLLHNSLGAWWVTRHPGEAPPVPLRYLRLKEGGTPIAGNLESWPDNLSELTILDPCCGSGHFLVAAFLLLVPMRIASEGLSAQEAVDAVLLDNLHGLELDSRCVAIAVFALALAAWRYPDEDGIQLGFRLKMPCPKVACSGLSPTSSADKWKSLIPVGCDQRDRLQAGLTQLHNCFLKAPLLGSLLHPRRLGEANLLTAGYDELRDLLKKALEREAMSSDDNDSYSGLEAAFTAKGLADAAILLDRKYHLVATNVPYLGSRDQSESLKDFCAKEYPDAKSDLANVFLERCLELSQSNGAGLTQVVMPQNWLFLGSYLNMRRELLSRRSIHHISLLGNLWATSAQGGHLALICA